MTRVVAINPGDPASIDAALRTEWLLTTGTGGYAMGNLLGANSRRYHGLLVGDRRERGGRVVLLHSMIEQLIIPREDGRTETVDLSTGVFTGGDGQALLNPTGWRHLVEVKIAPPRQIGWVYRIGEIEVRRHLVVSRGENAITLRYQFLGLPADATFIARPLLVLRDFHALLEGTGQQFHASTTGPYRTWSVNEMQLRMRARATWRDEPQWWNNVHYPLDRERGQHAWENVYSPGCVVIENARKHEPPLPPLELRFGDGGVLAPVREAPVQAGDDSPHQALRVAASQFVVRRQVQAQWFSSVIAGYPWFGEWGRDTMISLPGLMLCTGQLDEARSTLVRFARQLRHGLLPNLFDDHGGGAHYNAVDASLWFVNAVHSWWQAMQAEGRLPPSYEESSGAAGQEHPSASPNDRATAGALKAGAQAQTGLKGAGRVSTFGLRSACRHIIHAYRRGTDFKIRMDGRDGLIIAGDPSTQLTWMDAKRDGVVFTPRCGKPVEINALWHNALVCMAQMIPDPARREHVLVFARRVAASFREAFWWEERQCLHDCLAPLGSDAASQEARFEPDGKLRPNQILAASLPFSPLTKPQQRAVVHTVGQRLLTPFGLRTLDRDDPGYRGRYQGNLFERDAAYHNGTVWPWLIGPYCEALLRVENVSPDARRRVRQILQPLVDELSNASGGRCLDQIAEVYDGDAPHRPSGCPAQAWSVAEVLRILTLIDQ